jgi:hypothetical protein
MTKTRAEEELLGQLHEAVAKSLLQKVTTGEATAAELNAAIKFLQNNGIEAIQSENNPLGMLAAALPVFDDDIEEYPN